MVKKITGKTPKSEDEFLDKNTGTNYSGPYPKSPDDKSPDIGNGVEESPGNESAPNDNLVDTQKDESTEEGLVTDLPGGETNIPSTEADTQPAVPEKENEIEHIHTFLNLDLSLSNAIKDHMKIHLDSHKTPKVVKIFTIQFSEDFRSVVFDSTVEILPAPEEKAEQ